jgi:hypothetical protein
VNFLRNEKKNMKKNTRQTNKQAAKQISGQTTLAEVLEKPDAEQVLAKHKVPCLTCPFAKMEMNNLKLVDICKMYGIDCPKLLKELNEIKK